MTDIKEPHLYPSFLHYFDHWAALDPSAPALVFRGKSYSYQELALMARTMAEALRRDGVTAGATVAVGVGRNEALLPLLLAIWSLRAAYIPVDPSYPPHRQSYILEHAEVKILVADTPADDLRYAGKTVKLDSLLAENLAAPENLALAASDVADDDLAYIIYTSGSTGNPKGVAVGQGNVYNFLLAMREQPGLEKTDSLLAVTTISFDIHVLELFLPLLVGAQVVLASKDQSVSGQALQQIIDQHGINVMQATPATWRMLLSQDWLPKAPLKILIGGEALPRDLRPRLHAASSELWNMYGPTETTVWSTCHKISADDEKIYIGRPIRSTSVFIVDEHMQELADGTAGELLIGGAGVAHGYYNSPTLTGERFIEVPALAQGRLYRTGDLVVKHADGVLEYVNRLDNQIKIRGFRIEPADIEHALESHDAVAQAVVVASPFGEQDVRLVAFYLGQITPSSGLVEHCARLLPAHMLPQHIVHLHAFPMTANLKVDRKQLVVEAPKHVNSQSVVGRSNGRDDLDHSLVAVWEKTLGFRGIGIDDSFFDLGGHSLLALQVTRDMRTATGLDFPETILFEAPTIRAARDKMGDQVEQAASVVRLNDTTSGEPVFCLCGVRIYQDLAEQFEDQRPVYGVFAKKEIDFIAAKKTNREISFDFDSLVDSYVDAIRRQGDVPRLALMGLSFGGLVALEAAKKFRELGVEVSEVILLDTYTHSSSYRSSRQLMRDMAEQFRQAGFKSLWRDLTRRVRTQLSEKKRSTLRYFSVQEAEGQRERAFECAASHFYAQPKSYSFDALLIKASDTDFGFGRRPKDDYGLCDIIKGDLTVHSVPAEHTAMIGGRSAAQVYKIINNYMTTRK